MQVRHVAFEAIGTHWNIQVESNTSDAKWSGLVKRIRSRIDTFDKSYSRFRADSLVTKMSQVAGTYPLPPDGYMLLDFYRKLYYATEGKVTPLIGQAVADAGYDASYSFRIAPLHQPQSWDAVLDLSHSKLRMKQPALLDFGAAGKGYLVDIVGEILAAAATANYTINAGGDILHHTTQGKRLTVGLENPQDTSEVIGIATITNQSLCASAGSKRKWGKFHHVIDPDTLTSPSTITATWVIADHAMTADGLATALFFTDPAKLHDHFTFSCAVLTEDMTLTYERDFPLTVFEKQP